MELSARELRARSGLAEVRVYARLGSTNARAAELVERGELAPPAAVVASRQTAGRGRGTNRWLSDAGTLTATFVLPATRGMSPQETPLRAGLAVRRAVMRWVADAPGAAVTVKWPNDVLVAGRKIAGLLCERVRGADVIGVGVNVATDLSRLPESLQKRAVSLARLTQAGPTRGDVFVEITLALRDLWAEPNWHDELCRCHALTGRRVSVDTGDGVVTGECVRIDPDGALVLRDGAREARVLSGTVVG